MITLFLLISIKANSQTTARIGSTTGNCACDVTVCNGGNTYVDIVVPAGSRANISLMQQTTGCGDNEYFLDNGENVVMTWISNSENRSMTLFSGNGSSLATVSENCYYNNDGSSITLRITLASNRQDEATQVTYNVVSGNSSCSNLPVELTSFNAKLNSQSILLTWQTATELNNAKFIIETSTQGEVFQRIGEIAGAGTTTEPQNYTFTHHTPSAGMNYYRLKQVDVDGTFEYSKVIAINAPGSNDLFAFPNPTRDKITLQYDQSKGTGNIQLLDALGRRINANIGGYAGNYDIKLPEGLPKGTYWLRVERGGKVQTVPVVKE